jgi:hypothetical protein
VVLAADLTTCRRVQSGYGLVEFIVENPLTGGLIKIGEVAIVTENESLVEALPPRCVSYEGTLTDQNPSCRGGRIAGSSASCDV